MSDSKTHEQRLAVLEADAQQQKRLVTKMAAALGAHDEAPAYHARVCGWLAHLSIVITPTHKT